MPQNDSHSNSDAEGVNSEASSDHSQSGKQEAEATQNAAEASSEASADELPSDALKRELVEVQGRLFLKETQVKALETKLREFEVKTAEIREYVKKMEGEIALVRDRSAREAEKLVFQKFSSLGNSILPVMDNFERSLAAAKDEKSPLAEGVRMIHQQLLEGLRQIGILRMEAKGGKFDPNLHQAISTVKVDKKYDDDVVMQEVQAGYFFKDQLLRPAQVIVGKYGEDV